MPTIRTKTRGTYEWEQRKLLNQATDASASALATHEADADPHPDYLLNDGDTATGNYTFSGGTVTISIADINGGAIDGTPIGASSRAAGSFTTLSTTGLATFSLGASFGSTVAASVSDLSSHLALWGTTYGLNIRTLALQAVIPTGADFKVVGNGSDRLVVKADGRVYGTALHNNANAVTGTTNQYAASGTYTPTITNQTNIDASSSTVFQWTRIGNVVTVSGLVTIDPTAVASTSFDLSLPIASNFTNIQNAGGSAVALDFQGHFGAFADVANDRVEFRGQPQSAATQFLSVHFTYLIL